MSKVNYAETFDLGSVKSQFDGQHLKTFNDKLLLVVKVEDLQGDLANTGDVWFATASTSDKGLLNVTMFNKVTGERMVMFADHGDLTKENKPVVKLTSRSKKININEKE